jgi:hypothetical protein
MLEVGRELQTEKMHNFVRDTYRRINHWGIGWKVPLDVANFEFQDHSVVSVHYLPPKKLLQFLVEKKAHSVHGGVPNAIAAFWECYEKVHPSHETFVTHSDFAKVIPVCLHGDEGRGKRRSQTAVVSFECVLGMAGKPIKCTSCKPTSLPENDGDGWAGNPLCEQLVCNMKGHSFLQHFPLFVIPGTWWKTYKTLTFKMLERVSSDFHDLFYNGFQTSDGTTWHVAAVGSKGDLKWFSKICRLTRGYENKSTKTDIPHCHWCLGGTAGIPAEDLGVQPCWVPTIFNERPWSDNAPPALDSIPFDAERPEYFYKHDTFHTLRLGIFRHFCGSLVFMLLRTGFFGPGNVSSKLESAHGYFHLWQLAESKFASLRSFTVHLLCYKNAKVSRGSLVRDQMLDFYFCGFALCSMVHGILNQDGEQQRNNYEQILRIALATCEVAIDFYDMVVKHNMFLSRNCGSTLVEKGLSFCRGYTYLAKFAFSKQWCLFAIIPKAHFTRHIVQELEAQLAKGNKLLLNPLMFDCSQNEDFIGRICKMGRKIDARVMGPRLLGNYLIKAGILHNRFVKKRTCQQ